MKINNRNAYIAIYTLLILLGVISVLILGISFNSITEGQIALNSSKEDDSENLIDSCAEDSLMSLNRSVNLPPQIVLPIGTCQVELLEQIDNEWRYIVRNSNTDNPKSVYLNVVRTDRIYVIDWEYR